MSLYWALLNAFYVARVCPKSLPRVSIDYSIASRIPPGLNRRVASNVWAVCRPLLVSRLLELRAGLLGRPLAASGGTPLTSSWGGPGRRSDGPSPVVAPATTPQCLHSFQDPTIFCKTTPRGLRWRRRASQKRPQRFPRGPNRLLKQHKNDIRS